METRLITQPFDQDGNHQNLGDILQNILASDDLVLNDVWFVSAWVNHNTIRRLYTTLERLRDGGTNIHIYFGINLQGTLLEAIRSIHRLRVDSKIIYNPTYRNTFHPKIFVLEGQNSAHVFIGSNNLTDGGLYRNYEATTWLLFEFPQDAAQYSAIRGQLTEFLEPNEAIAVDLTEGLIESLVQQNLVLSRREARERWRRAYQQEEEAEVIADRVDTDAVEMEALPFRSVPIPNAPAVGEQQDYPEFQPIAQANIDETLGQLVWRKPNLPISDVQRPGVPRQSGNPTGGLRLTQARFEVDGQVIDQTSYFRHVVFSEGYWATNQYSPLQRETARFSFEVIIRNEFYGIHELTVSHKPTGEAGQGNYTTILHWGHLGNLIRQLNLISSNFDLYRLPEEAEADFRIVIS